MQGADNAVRACTAAAALTIMAPRVAAVLVLCCVLAEGAAKNKWKDKKCAKKQAQGLCATSHNCPKKAKKCEKTAKWRGLKEEQPVLGRPRKRHPPPTSPCWLGELVG